MVTIYFLGYDLSPSDEVVIDVVPRVTERRMRRMLDGGIRSLPAFTTVLTSFRYRIRRGVVVMIRSGVWRCSTGCWRCVTVMPADAGIQQYPAHAAPD